MAAALSGGGRLYNAPPLPLRMTQEGTSIVAEYYGAWQWPCVTNDQMVISMRGERAVAYACRAARRGHF